MTGREIILARIREALRQPAKSPPESSGEPSAHGAREWLPAVGESFEAQRDLFQKNAEALKATFIPCASETEALEKFREIAKEWKTAALHEAPLLEPFAGVLASAGVKVLHAPALGEEGAPRDWTAALEACDAGITTCECLVAQTGSVLVTSTLNGGRALSVLPPRHVVIARRGQLLPDLTEAFRHIQKKYPHSLPGMLSFITGPSRTGDIERILVLGAHGPKELTILLLP